MTRGYGDTFPDTAENRSTIGGFGTGGDVLKTIRKPTNEERARARRYLQRMAPDLIDALGLA